MTISTERQGGLAPVPNPPVRPGARRSPEDEALVFLRSSRDTHTRWAEYFEQNPSVEKEYLATGVWEGAADQRGLERKYNAVIATFERLIGCNDVLHKIERKLEQIKRIALSCEGHSYDMIYALADEAAMAMADAPHRIPSRRM